MLFVWSEIVVEKMLSGACVEITMLVSSFGFQLIFTFFMFIFAKSNLGKIC